MSVTTYLATSLVDHVLGGAAYTAPGTVYAALYTSAPSDGGGGTEASGAGYSRQAVTWGTVTGGEIANSAAIVWNVSGGDLEALRAVGLLDAATGGNLLWWGSIPLTTALDGGGVRIAAGSLIVSLE